ncbi:hypothetical protein OH76DRAFT_537392 [Lentinus brumalis]|uniref:Uncharacterized protein n=1 Tax=Lentinus brumalis TaxID=2498619 RepID=A0A371DAH5_9APHY|nr:hypothetical protein OH76DRAFT_537392 [Polyporus brumalis]
MLSPPSKSPASHALINVQHRPSLLRLVFPSVCADLFRARCGLVVTQGHRDSKSSRDDTRASSTFQRCAGRAGPLSHDPNLQSAHCGRTLRPPSVPIHPEPSRQRRRLNRQHCLPPMPETPTHAAASARTDYLAHRPSTRSTASTSNMRAVRGPH